MSGSSGEGPFSMLGALIGALVGGLNQATAGVSSSASAAKTQAAARRAERKARERRRAWLDMQRRQAIHGNARDATEAEAIAMLATRGGGRPNPLDERKW